MSKKCTKKCAVCACRLLILPRSSINILLFDVFIAVAVVVATALYFDLKRCSVMTYGKNQNV